MRTGGGDCGGGVAQRGGGKRAEVVEGMPREGGGNGGKVEEKTQAGNWGGNTGPLKNMHE